MPRCISSSRVWPRHAWRRLRPSASNPANTSRRGVSGVWLAESVADLAAELVAELAVGFVRVMNLNLKRAASHG